MSKIVAGLLVLILSFLALEGMYRAYKYWRYGMVDYIDLMSVGYMEPHPLYGAVLVKSFRSDRIPSKVRFSQPGLAYHMDRQFTTNPFGYRGREFNVAKDPDTFRVVVFGGSTTMGVEVDDPDTWPALLQTQLSRDHSFLLRHGVKNRTEQNRTEQNRTEQNRSHQCRCRRLEKSRGAVTAPRRSSILESGLAAGCVQLE